MTEIDTELIRAGLCQEEKHLKDILHSLESHDLTLEAALDGIRRVELGLRRLRRAA